MSNDPHAGQGGSYEMDASGNRVLRERTGWTPDEPTADASAKPVERPRPKPMEPIADDASNP